MFQGPQAGTCRQGGEVAVLKVNVELDREVDSNAFKIVLEMTRTSRAYRMEIGR